MTDCGNLKLDIGAGPPFNWKEGDAWYKNQEGFIIISDYDWSDTYKDNKTYTKDLENEDLPFCENSCVEVRAMNFFEHLTVDGLERVMNECHRVLKPEGLLYVQVPYFQSRQSFRDPTHQRTFDDSTFEHYFTREEGKTEYKFKFWHVDKVQRIEGHNDIIEVWMKPDKE